MRTAGFSHTPLVAGLGSGLPRARGVRAAEAPLCLDVQIPLRSQKASVSHTHGIPEMSDSRREVPMEHPASGPSRSLHSTLSQGASAGFHHRAGGCSRPRLHMRCTRNLCHCHITCARKHVGNVLPGVLAGYCCSSEAGHIPPLPLGCVHVGLRRAVQTRLQPWAAEKHLPAAPGKIKPSRSSSQGRSGCQRGDRPGGGRSDVFPQVPGVRGAARPWRGSSGRRDVAGSVIQTALPAG